MSKRVYCPTDLLTLPPPEPVRQQHVFSRKPDTLRWAFWGSYPESADLSETVADIRRTGRDVKTITAATHPARLHAMLNLVSTATVKAFGKPDVRKAAH